ncbi:protein of unknown function [Burkholderia multivorans]
MPSAAHRHALIHHAIHLDAAAPAAGNARAALRAGRAKQRSNKQAENRLHRLSVEP